MQQNPIDEQPSEGSKKLYIIFGGLKAGVGMPPFEFVKAANILTEHKIFVRDFSQAWYHRGLPGISNNLTETSDYLRERINTYKPEETVLIGNSMGGFAAILFASMLSNCRAIAISPQTYLGIGKRLVNRERRWRSELRKTYFYSFFGERRYDLASINPKNSSWHADILLSANHARDLSHAKNVAHIPQIRIHKFDCKSHRLVKKLRDVGMLNKILLGEIPPTNRSGVIPIADQDDPY